MAEARIERHKLHYQTWAPTRRAVARGLGKRYRAGDAAQEYKVSVGMREPWSCTAGPVVAGSVAVTGIRLTVLIGASPPWLLEIH